MPQVSRVFITLLPSVRVDTATLLRSAARDPGIRRTGSDAGAGLPAEPGRTVSERANKTPYGYDISHNPLKCKSLEESSAVAEKGRNRRRMRAGAPGHPETSLLAPRLQPRRQPGETTLSLPGEGRANASGVECGRAGDTCPKNAAPAARRGFGRRALTLLPLAAGPFLPKRERGTPTAVPAPICRPHTDTVP